MAEQIVLLEAMRSVLYVPLYLAAARGEWEKHGLRVDIATSATPAKVIDELNTGGVDVCLGATVRVLQAHDRDPENAPVVLGQVLERDPLLLVGSRPNPDFRFRKLVGLRFANASEAPFPWLGLRDDLSRDGIEPAHLTRADGPSMAENADRLLAGKLDVIQVFEPHAARLVRQGAGHVWHRFATRGPVCFSTLFTSPGFVVKRPAACTALVNSLACAQEALFDETSRAVAEQVQSFLPDINLVDLTSIVEDYRRSGVWARTPDLTADAMVRLKSILIAGGLLNRDVPFEMMVCVEKNSG